MRQGHSPAHTQPVPRRLRCQFSAVSWLGALLSFSLGSEVQEADITPVSTKSDIAWNQNMEGAQVLWFGDPPAGAAEQGRSTPVLPLIHAEDQGPSSHAFSPLGSSVMTSELDRSGQGHLVFCSARHRRCLWSLVASRLVLSEYMGSLCPLAAREKRHWLLKAKLGTLIPDLEDKHVSLVSWRPRNTWVKLGQHVGSSPGHSRSWVFIHSANICGVFTICRCGSRL
jgi:hypothetical protein